MRPIVLFPIHITDKGVISVLSLWGFPITWLDRLDGQEFVSHIYSQPGNKAQHSLQDHMGIILGNKVKTRGCGREAIKRMK